ncbi:MAG: hypothetical protein AAGD14_12940 [Planctomycetota bacterium]
MQKAWLPLLLLVGCASPSLGTAGELCPLTEGQQRVYEIRDERQRVVRLDTRRVGGDVRRLGDQESVPFVFVFGTPDGMEHPTHKWIYAMPADGPRAFHFDALGRSLQHDPPIPLFPGSIEKGAEFIWIGTVTANRVPTRTSATIRIAGRETLTVRGTAMETVRVETTYGGADLEVTRWFARDMGVVRMEIRAEPQRLEMVLVGP